MLRTRSVQEVIGNLGSLLQKNASHAGVISFTPSQCRGTHNWDGRRTSILSHSAVEYTHQKSVRIWAAIFVMSSSANLCAKVVFRGGPEQDYAPFAEVQSLPVISVAPVRRPKLDESGTKYSFAAEKELMREKMRAVLRIASYCGHRNLVLGAFGLGPIFKNPATEVARMWRTLLFEDDEFFGVFQDIVFAIDSAMVAPATKGGMSDLEIFRREFDPSLIFPVRYQARV